jgi:cytochrome c oxidase subunit 2
VSTRARRRLVAIAIAVGATTAGCRGGRSFLDAKGSEAERVAGVWWLMFGLAAAVYVIVAGCIVYAATRGRRRRTQGSRLQENWFIWIGGVIAPLVVLAVLAVVTVDTTSALRTSPKDELTIDVVGKLWWWEIRYPGTGVTTANEIHIPEGRPVNLHLTSDNVIHSFWVPELAGKEDAIPGQPNDLEFTADHVGRFQGRCAEYCGLQHAHMGVDVIVQTPGDFGRWLAQRQQPPLEPPSEEAATGALVFQRQACAGCHTIRGTAAQGDVGPDLTDVGSRRLIGAGATTNTRSNLEHWIRDAPDVKPGVLMPSFTNLSDHDVAALAAYLESLQ